ncbi:sensor histidine kinase [Spongiactinospora gelatinilytica]|uniref:histidine kinase n=1 Tax=Spongiactinospora gelatinilytica TaxID=2666298 RepID=A0A2W2GDH0_9ACTN|nr:ATP-binding protein [Spongiactinospora gelatinilytica]PZG46471.1 sensor histidine kinase [Spongiactinospora gelatinilytica]
MTARSPAGRLAGHTIGRLLLLTAALMGVLLVAGAALTSIALGDGRQARHTILDVIDPAILRTMDLATAQGAQRAAIAAHRAEPDAGHLTAYRAAMAAERAASGEIARLVAGQEFGEPVTAVLARLGAASERWRAEYADPVAAGASGDERAGEVRQAAVHTELTALRQRLADVHRTGGAAVNDGAGKVYVALAIWTGLLVAALAGLAVVLRMAVLRPVNDLAAQVGTVASGDFDHRVRVRGPAELAALAADVDDMRERILAEWRIAQDARRRLEDQAAELRRSNGELEQFAYVASHDLQEPLRKVAGFTQMLEQRYAADLDDRARQYIAYAVDGAKRMQKLINDLLDFSRVGKAGGALEMTDSGEALRSALRDLAAAVEESEARIEYGALPRVYASGPLLARLWQNVLSNAVKFRSAERPHIRISAVRDGEMWVFSCSDNGIGIDPRHTDRIFLIFQRLHSREAYPGTGIGLAMAKKIVEYLSGRIWVEHGDTETPGTTFRWTVRADPPGDPLPGSGADDG